MKKALRYIPFIFVIVAIFALTAQSKEGTVGLSDTFMNVLVKICSRLGMDVDSEWWNSRVNIRWLGHTIEYFALGLAAGAMFKRKWIALPVCLFISVIDQLTKIFIPVRHFDAEDIPFDIVGFCGGIAIAWVISIAVRAMRREWEGDSE